MSVQTPSPLASHFKKIEIVFSKAESQLQDLSAGREKAWHKPSGDYETAMSRIFDSIELRLLTILNGIDKFAEDSGDDSFIDDAPAGSPDTDTEEDGVTFEEEETEEEEEEEEDSDVTDTDSEYSE